MRHRTTWIVMGALGVTTAAIAASISQGPLVPYSSSATLEVLRAELAGFANYGAADGRADIFANGDSHTYTLDYTPPADQCGAEIRAAVALDDHYAQSPASYALDIQIDGVTAVSGTAQALGLPHGSPFGASFTNWAVLTADAGDVSDGTTDVTLAVTTPSNGDWIAFDYLEIAFDVGTACCPSGYDVVDQGCVHPTATVDPGATIGRGAKVHARAVVGASTLLPGAIIGPKATVGDGSTIGGFVGRRARIGDSVSLADGSVLARGTEVHAGVTATGPVVLGYGARIGPDATLGSGVVIGNLATVDGGADLGDGARLGRGAHVGPDAVVGSAAQIGPGARLAPEAQVLDDARVRRGARLGWSAVARSSSRVGRDARIDAGATIGIGATVRAGATVGSGSSVTDGDVVGRAAGVTPTTAGAVLQDVVLTGGSGLATTASPATFKVLPGSIELTATAIDSGGGAPTYAWSLTGSLPAGWSLFVSGTTKDVLTVNVPSDGTVYLTLAATDGGAVGTTETIRVTTLDLPPGIPIVDVGGGVNAYADGTHPTACDGYKNAAPAGYEVAAADGVYRIDPLGTGATLDVACDMDFQGGGWTLVRRRDPGATGWHPVNDNATGTTAYGTYTPDPLAPSSFSTTYDTWTYAEYLFATGDQARWVQLDRAEIDRSFIATNLCNSGTTVTAAHSYATPRVVNMCMRNGNPEDPWISADDHLSGGTSATNDNDTYSMLYGEAGYNGWNHHRVNRGGANVWVR